MWKHFAVAMLAVALLLVPAQQASALQGDELLALVAMPLAVAAVSEIADVPMNELIDVVSLMNDAAVPPVQFVEVVRYAPAALVYETDGPTFVEYVRLQEREGLRGMSLVDAIERQMIVYGLRDIDFDRPAIRVIEVVDSGTFIPPIVRTRVADWRSSHPHGGPPGQLKKELGLKTGAEVVHGSQPGRNSGRRVIDDDRGRAPKQRAVKDRDDNRPNRAVERGGGKGKPNAGNRGGGKGKGNGGGQGKGKGKG